MFKRIIEKEVNKQVNERIEHNRNSKNLSDLFDKAQKINSSNLKEISELKEKLEASQRREESLYKQIDDDEKEISELKVKLEASQIREESMHKQIDDDGKEIKDLKEKIIELQKQYLNSHFGFNRDEMIKQFVKPFDVDKALKQLEDNQPIVLSDKPQPITWFKFMKQPDGISDNLADDDVNNLPFYTLEYSVDGQQESLINLSLHDCEELYGQIIGLLEYFKMTKQEKFIEDTSACYTALGSIHLEGVITFARDVSSIDEMFNSILTNGKMNRCNTFSFYKNGNLFCEMSANKFLHTKWGTLRKELEGKEKEIDNEVQKDSRELSNEYIAYGETFGDNLLNYGVFSSLNNLCNEVLRRPDLKLSKAIRFYKNGKRFAILDIGTLLFTDIDDIRKELFRLEKEIDKK